MPTDLKPRRYELDWLRVMAILVVFFYHSMRFFNLEDWHVKNDASYLWVELLTLFISRWMMPLFFVISGASLFMAIRRRGGFSKFYTSKFMRLMIPLIVGSITHAALQIYLENFTHGRFTGPFWAFIPHYLEGVYLYIGGSGKFAFGGMHLWYLLVLFIYSLACYPLFVWFSDRGQAMAQKAARLMAMPGLIYFWFALPLLFIRVVVPEAVLMAGAGGWGFIYYLWFLIAGGLMIASERLQQVIRQQRRVSLGLGILLSTAYLFQMGDPSGGIIPPGHMQWLEPALTGLSTWCWLFTILGFAMQHLTFNRPMLSHANEGVLAFYILHQTVLVTLGYFIVQLDISDFAKWGAIFVCALITIMIIYIPLIRNSQLLRFLFGMKSNHALVRLFNKKAPLITAHLLYVGLILFAAMHPASGAPAMRSTFDPARDIVLDADAVKAHSETGVRVTEDKEAATGRAIEFTAGPVQQISPVPDVYIDLQFSAPAGRYFIWLRGKSDMHDKQTDSVWLQADQYIHTRWANARLGNWLDIYPPGAYHWAGDAGTPRTIRLGQSGEHTIRLQPRQVPHRIDQIWLSRRQARLPDSGEPVQ